MCGIVNCPSKVAIGQDLATTHMRFPFLLIVKTCCCRHLLLHEKEENVNRDDSNSVNSLQSTPSSEPQMGQMLALSTPGGCETGLTASVTGVVVVANASALS